MRKCTSYLLSPFVLPILFFMGTIAIGSAFLHSSTSLSSQPLSWLDSVFTATSATCVTGLAVVDTGTFFSRSGQTVIMILIQLGGLGIMTFSGLAFYLVTRKVSLKDRVMIGQSLLHDPNFHLGRFLLRIVCWTFIIEATGAVFLFLQDPGQFTPFSALFHAISAFCNAGFSLQADSLMRWQYHWGINIIFMVLIIVGGLGFSVLYEGGSFLRHSLARGGTGRRLSWYARVILRTSGFLILLGWCVIFLAEYVGYPQELPGSGEMLTSLFQSVTCRTAGFNTVDISRMTTVSILAMIFLMFIGGASGSCAGGIKISTFRTIVAYIFSQFRGRRQAVIGEFSVGQSTVNKAFILVTSASTLILAATFLLTITEGGDIPHGQARGLFLDLLFEAVSAFGTVGLSTGVTPTLSIPGKIIIITLMFVGRLGPIIFLTAIQHFQEEPLYSWPQEEMLVG